MKTRAVARLLGQSPANLIAGIREGRFPPPEKDELGHYVWTARDIEAARTAMRRDKRFGKRKATA
jgi:hypothetical protein